MRYISGKVCCIGVLFTGLPGAGYHHPQECQVVAGFETGPIGVVMNAVHRLLDLRLGKSRGRQGRDRLIFCYRFMSEMEPVQKKRSVEYLLRMLAAPFSGASWSSADARR